MRELNIVKHEHTVTWKRADFACAIIVHRAQCAEHDDAGGLYSETPTAGQLAHFGVSDEEIDELVALCRPSLSDASIAAGWELIESCIDSLEFRGDWQRWS